MRGTEPFATGHEDEISPDQRRGCFCSDEEELVCVEAVVEMGRDEASSTGALDARDGGS